MAKNHKKMSASCAPSILADALSIVMKALSSRPTIPALEGVLIEATPDQLRLTCSDMNLGITTTIGAIVTTPGRLLLPGTMFNAYVRKASGAELNIVEGEGIVQLSTAANRTKMAIMDADGFPELPKVDNPTSVLLPGESFARLVGHTAFAASQDGSRPILTGINVSIGGGLCRAVALDGNLLSYCAEPYSGEAAAISCTVPADAMKHLASLSQPEQPVRLEIGNTYLASTIGETRSIVRLLAGEFVKYERLMPAESRTMVQVEKKMLADALDRVAILSPQGANAGTRGHLVTLRVSDEDMELYTQSERGEANEHIEVRREGQNIEISFNSRYLRDIIKSCDGDIFTMRFTTARSIAIIRPDAHADNTYFIVTPVITSSSVAS